MEWIVLPVYAACIVVNLKNKAFFTVSLCFFLPEYAHFLMNFEYASAHYFSIALMTLFPAYACKLLPPERARRLVATCLGLICIYFMAWVCSEAGLPESQFKWPHIAILIYQGGLLNGGTGIMDDFRHLLANASEYLSRIRLRYHSGN